MPKVLNARQAGTKPAADRVYVGRPSKWGNLSGSAATASPLNRSPMAPALSAIVPTAGILLCCGK